MKTISVVLLTLLSFNAISQQLLIQRGHNESVNGFKKTPDGKYAVTIGDDGFVKLWNQQMILLAERRFDEGCHDLAIDYTNKKIAVVRTSGDVCILDLTTLDVLKTIVAAKKNPYHLQPSVQYLADGKQLLVAAPNQPVTIYHTNTYEIADQFSKEGFKELFPAAVSADEKYICVGSYDSKQTLVWDRFAKNIIAEIPAKGRVTEIRWLQDKNAFSINGYKDFQIYDITTGQTQTINEFDAPISSLMLNPNEFVVGCKDGLYKYHLQYKNKIKLHDLEWVTTYVDDDQSLYYSASTNLYALDLENEKPTKLNQDFTFFQDLVLSPKKDLIAFGSFNYSSYWDETVKVIDVSNGDVRQLKTANEENKFMHVTYDDRGENLFGITFHGAVIKWRLNDGKQVAQYKSAYARYDRIAFDPIQKRVIVQNTSAKVLILTDNLEPISEFKVPDKLIFATDLKCIDRKIIITGHGNSRSETIYYVSDHDGNTIYQENGATRYALSDDGRFVLAFTNESVFLKNNNGQILQTVTNDKQYKNGLIINEKEVILKNGNGDIFSWKANASPVLVGTLPTGDLLVLKNMNGEYVYAITNDQIAWYNAKLQHVCSTLIFFNGDYIHYNAQGQFDYKGDLALASLSMKISKDEVLPINQFFDRLYTPKLFEHALNGIATGAVNLNTALKAPPVVRIVAPAAYSRSQTQTINVTVSATDMGGGIDEIRLYHNNKLVESTDRGFKPIESRHEEKIKSFSISLVNGKNVLRAVAFNNQRTESLPHEIETTFSAPNVTKPDLYLFVVGLNHYTNPKYNLNYAEADATAFRQHIENYATGIFANIKTRFLANEQVTKSQIQAEMSKIKSQARAEDVFIFYYAGHGVMSEETTPQFYIVPSDVTQLYGNDELLKTKALSATEMKKFSTELKAQKQLFILDACQAGGMVGMLATRGAAEEKALHQLARSTGTYWLAASNSEQFAGEFKQLGHGVFTYAILEGLTGKADSHQDKTVTVQEISVYVNERVPVLSKEFKGAEQFPNTYGYGHDFPLTIVK